MRWNRVQPWIVVSLALAVMIASPAASTSHAATAEEVDVAIKKAVAYLYSTQKDNNWEQGGPPGDHGQWGGVSALATYALLASGEKPQANPKLQGAVQWLLQNKINGIYALGVRTQVWYLLSVNGKDDALREAIKRDGEVLLLGARKAGPLSAFRGKYHYLPTDRSYDNSAAQYGVLGMWALERAGLEIPDAYWQAVEEAWKKDQQRNGTWSYKATPDGKGDSMGRQINMTAAGIATLFIAQDYLHGMKGINCSGNVTNEPIARGMAWMEENLPKSIGAIDLYGWYGIERIGVASGYKYFGTMDWYKEAAEQLVKKRQGQNGEMDYKNKNIGTAFGILVLSRGRAPVVMNKLQYSIGGKEASWNQRPRDSANVVRYMSRQMERDLNWQIVNLRVPIDDLHDSPILYISGNQALAFTEEEKAKIKTFIEQGGLVVGHADCADPNFSKSFTDLGESMFKYEFSDIQPNHAIHTRQQFLFKNWKVKPKLKGMNNGVRELMLLIPEGDPGKAWQMGDDRSKEEQFQMMSNIFLYAVEGRDLRYKGATYLVAADPKIKATKPIKVARLELGDNADPEPGGWRRLANVMQNQHAVDLQTKLVKLEGENLKDYKIAHLTGTTKMSALSADQQKAIKDFIAAGGTFVIDAAGGSAEFGASMKDVLNALYPAEAAKDLNNLIPGEHALFSASGKPVGEVTYRPFARGRVAAGTRNPQLRGINIDGRLAIIFSEEDLSGGLVGQSVDGIAGYTVDSATSLMKSVLMFANAAQPAKPVAIAAPTTQAAK